MHFSLQDGETALMKASEAGKVECIKVLLDRGAEVNMQDKVSGVVFRCVVTLSVLLFSGLCINSEINGRGGRRI